MLPVSAVELLLREQVDSPLLKFAPGRELAARVIVPQGQGALGKLAVAGMTLDAALPPNLRAGQEVQLVVRELTPERITLGLIPPLGVEPAHAMLPGGGKLRVTEREARATAAGAEIKVSALTIRYEAPNLGAVDLCFRLTPTGLQLSVLGAAGEALEAMRMHVGELRGALQQASPGAVVTVGPRRDLVTYA